MASPTSLELGSIRAITFDCYGTLIDWEAGIRAVVAPALRAARREEITPEAWIARWEPIQLELLRPYRPYREVLRHSYDLTMRSFEIYAFADGGPGLARSVAAWEPFPDTTRALRRLGRRFRLGIISNIDNDQLAASMGRLQAPLSTLVTAEDAQAFKPDPRPFQLALERLGLAPHEVLHAAFGWRYDLEPARALGMRTAFIQRGEARLPDGVATDLQLPSLQALAERLGV